MMHSQVMSQSGGPEKDNIDKVNLREHHFTDTLRALRVPFQLPLYLPFSGRRSTH